jgi:tetratricopeptide (TPR) repeat protein
MAAGKRPRDETAIASWLQQSQEQAEEFERKGELGKAYQAYAAIVSDFAKLADVAAAREKVASLQDRSETKAYLKDAAVNEERYNESLSRSRMVYAQLKGPLHEPGKGRKIIAELKISGLRKMADSQKTDPEQVIARRLLAELFAQAALDGNNYLQKKDSQRAIIAFQIANEIKPEHANVLYALAGALALNGDRKKALKTLAEAVSLGFADADSLSGDAEWDGLRADGEFIKILTAIQKIPASSKR